MSSYRSVVWEYTYLSEYVIVRACMITIYTYHMSNSHEPIGVNGEALQLHAVYKMPYFVLEFK